MHINLDIYLSLVNRRGWSETAYRHWLADTLTAALLLPAGRRLAEPPHTGAEQAPEIARPLSSMKRAALSLLDAGRPLIRRWREMTHRANRHAGLFV